MIKKKCMSGKAAVLLGAALLTLLTACQSGSKTAEESGSGTETVSEAAGEESEAEQLQQTMEYVSPEQMRSTDRITLISPDGTVLYDSVARADAMENHLSREEVAQALREGTPLGRTGTPREAGEAIAYLLEAEFLTGQVLGLNGGMVV